MPGSTSGSSSHVAAPTGDPRESATRERPIRLRVAGSVELDGILHWAASAGHHGDRSRSRSAGFHEIVVVLVLVRRIVTRRGLTSPAQLLARFTVAVRVEAVGVRGVAVELGLGFGLTCEVRSVEVRAGSSTSAGAASSGAAVEALAGYAVVVRVETVRV